MNSAQLPSLDHTVQQTNAWLKKLEHDHHFQDRHHAYSALRAVLHALRDRLTVEQAVHLGAQFPMLIRGIYYEGWHIDEKRAAGRQVDDFAATVAHGLPPQFPRDAVGTTEAVFDILSQELDQGAITKLIAELPVPLRTLWPDKVRN